MKKIALLTAATALLFAGTAADAKNCRKGKPCGNSCISWDKVCRIGTPARTPVLPAIDTEPRKSVLSSCEMAISIGKRDIPRGSSLYHSGLDRDNDGIACESGGDDSFLAGQTFNGQKPAPIQGGEIYFAAGVMREIGSISKVGNAYQFSYGDPRKLLNVQPLNATMQVNGETYLFDSPPFINKGKFYLPTSALDNMRCDYLVEEETLLMNCGNGEISTTDLIRF